MRFPLLVLTLLLFSQPVFAQDAEATHSASHLAATHELLEAMDAESTMLETSTAMFGQMQLPPEVKEVMVSFMAEVMNWEKLGPIVAGIYADAFTESELRELATFYSSPIGQKFVTSQPEVSARMMEVTQTIMAENQGRMMELMQAAMSKQ